MMRFQTFWTGLPGGPGVTTFYTGNIMDPLDVLAAVVAIGDFWDDLSGGLHTGVSWEVSGVVDEINPLNGELLGSTTVEGIGGSGENVLQPLPWQTQGLVDLATDVIDGGRRIRGWFNIPGYCENASETGVGPDSAHLSAVNGALGDLKTALDTWGVWSRKNGTLVPVALATLNPRWATLRGRLR